MQFDKFRIAARGLVIQNNKLLFVSDDGHYWYLPGGRLEAGESLPICVEREVYEETGFKVKAEHLCYVQERLDIKDHTHKLHLYFYTTILEENTNLDWQDQGGTVRHQRFFSLSDIQSMNNIVPRFLANGEWCSMTATVLTESSAAPIYQGAIMVKGFEAVAEEI